MTESKRPVVGISMGDPNGIGPEIILKSLKEPMMLDLFLPVIYGSQRAFSHYKKLYGWEDIHLQYVKEGIDRKSHKIQMVCIPDEGFTTQPGENTLPAGQLAVQSFCKAVADLKSQVLDALVTGPIHKQNTCSDTFPFKGHTEYLAHVTGESPLMMLCSGDALRVALCTVHVPIKEVSGQLNQERLLWVIKKTRQTLMSDFKIQKPKIAVLGLNPHAGDQGLMGLEERDCILPAIKHFPSDQLIFGPYSADAFFGKSSYTMFDAVIAMYHDQGLIPFKMKAFYSGVNVSAGTNLIRTSPDHGTAFDIAGKNLAAPDSFREALYMAVQIFKNRVYYASISKNPLPFQERRKER